MLSFEIKKSLEKNIHYTFKDDSLLEAALIHSSYVNENKREKVYSNERLEFLGDSVLSLSVSQKIYTMYPNEPEGNLTKLRSGLVCEDTLSIIGETLHLGDFLVMGKGEELTGGRTKPSVLADGVEALCAAVFLDSDYLTAQTFVFELYRLSNISFTYQENIKDYKSILQKSKQNLEIEYIVDKVTGPDHSPHFFMSVILNGKVWGKGEGKNKKSAEQMAAKNALKNFSIIND